VINGGDLAKLLEQRPRSRRALTDPARQNRRRRRTL